MLKLKNIELPSTIAFLNRISLRTKASRARTLLVKKLDVRLQEYVKFQQEILDKFAVKDDTGEVVKDEHGVFTWQADHVQEGNEAFKELGEEEVFLNIEEYRPNMAFLKAALDDLDMELSGVDALVYDLLMDQLEEETKGEDE